MGHPKYHGTDSIWRTKVLLYSIFRRENTVVCSFYKLVLSWKVSRNHLKMSVCGCSNQIKSLKRWKSLEFYWQEWSTNYSLFYVQYSSWSPLTGKVKSLQFFNCKICETYWFWDDFTHSKNLKDLNCWVFLLAWPVK